MWKANRKITFLENVRILLEARGSVLYSFKSNLFPIENSTPDPALDPQKFINLNKPEREVGYLKSKYFH